MLRDGTAVSNSKLTKKKEWCVALNQIMLVHPSFVCQVYVQVCLYRMAKATLELHFLSNA
jgi:hypothetical protein